MMNKEIKFRAWDKTKKEMYYWDIFQQDQTHTDWIGHTIVMQFTGLKDKNGMEIYEGDIVKFGTDDKHIVGYEENRDVRYGHGDCGETYSIGFSLGSSYGRDNEIEIIGNIHENPNLIKP